jgi:hypothetical protein
LYKITKAALCPKKIGQSAASFGKPLRVVSLVTRIPFEKVQKSSPEGNRQSHADSPQGTIEGDKKYGVTWIVPWYVPWKQALNASRQPATK